LVQVQRAHHVVHHVVHHVENKKKMKYTLLEKDKIRFIGLILLNEIINFQTYFSVIPVGDQLFLDHYLKLLNNKGFLRIEKGQYVPTQLGREEVVKLYEKYYEYLKIYDLYCAVDLQEGEFAFSRIFDNFSEDQWIDFLSNERFSDVRVAVADYKGLNPIEIVFLSFLNENRFDCTDEGWAYRLTGPNAWDEILEICNSAISREHLEADGVLDDILSQGTELALNLLAQAEEIAAGEETEEEEENYEVEETVEEEVIEYVEIVEMPTYEYSYWQPYRDPFYVSPIWIAPILLWD
jgi:hypothetical protein